MGLHNSISFSPSLCRSFVDRSPTERVTKEKKKKKKERSNNTDEDDREWQVDVHVQQI